MKREGSLRVFALLAVVVAAAGCDDPVTPIAPTPCGSISPATVRVGEASNVNACFNDANGDVLTYSASSSSPSVARATVAGTVITVTAIAPGNATITVIATDPSGLKGQQSFAVTVPNRSPQARGMLPGTTVQVGETARIDVSHHFSEPDGEVLSYTAVPSSAAGVISVSMSGSTLTIMGLALGRATATVTASDPAGLTATQKLDVTVTVSERDALMALYHSAAGESWRRSDRWGTNAPIGDWYGVEVNAAGRVVRLDLSGEWDSSTQQWVRHGLAGPIAPEVGKLASLKELSLFGNRLTGEIPPELGDLASLEKLSLSENRLTGEIPSELGNLASLEELYVNWNRLTGEIPPELGRLASLENLQLRHNRLSGRIPPELGKLADLTYLGLGRNRLSGEIPPELGGLASLETLSLDYNALTGPVPPELGNLANLTYLYLRSNGLSGPIPRSFLQLQLRRFRVADTDICVPGTSAFAEWLRGLEYFDPDDTSACNAADADVLESLYRATGGANWTESRGWLTDAVIGDWYGIETDSLGMVKRIDLRNNALSGDFPIALTHLRMLEEALLTDNDLAGRLPLGLRELPLRTVLVDRSVCAPPDASFQNWWRGVPNRLELPACDAPSDRDVLVALYHATGGDRWARNDNWLSDEPLSMWYGVRTRAGSGDRGQMAPPVPPLTQAHDADTHGGLPDAILDELRNGETGAELARILSRWITPLVADDDRTKTGNPSAVADPTRAAAVQTTTDGAVIELSLRRNNLSGRIPPELGHLEGLQRLDLGDNELSGPIPPELGGLSRLNYLGVTRNGLSGPVPGEIGRLSNLESLALGGNELSGPLPPALGNLSRLRRTNLWGNNFTGPIPRQFGNLSRLNYLGASRNRLSGPIPGEIGRLSNLETLSLGGNELSGPLPAELGELSRLEEIFLWGNDFTGGIPASIGNLRNLAVLSAQESGLSGPVPPELGRLSRLEWLELGGNQLSASLPPALADMPRLVVAGLGGNDFTGPVPASFGGLATLEWLDLADNEQMAGALPGTLTALDRLVRLQLGNTDLCAPADPGFLAWLQGVTMQRVRACGHRRRAEAYLVQSTQSAEFPVPLVAGRDALVRVFVTADSPAGARIPPVRARFELNGQVVHTAHIPAGRAEIPTEPREESLRLTANAVIPGAVIRPGLEMVVEIDPGRTLDPALRIARRIPESGTLALDVRDMPAMRVTVVPFLPRGGVDPAVRDRIEGLTAADPLFDPTRARLPVGQLSVSVRSGVHTSTNDMFDLLDELEAVRQLDGADTYYLGMVAGPAGPDWLGGVAAGIPSRSSMSRLRASTIAHEFGHNMHLYHASCSGGEGGPDPNFPHAYGSVGSWGYDFATGSLVDPGTPDFMSYCDPEWVGGYHFSNALRWRLESEPRAARGDAQVAEQVLLVWGGEAADGTPSLKPSFVLDGRPTLPDTAGDWHVAGEHGSGAELFALDFHMPEVADGDGRRSFVFSIPADPAWAGELARITLSGPGGSASLGPNSAPAMALLRDRATGRVRGFLRNPPDPDGLVRGEAGALAALALDAGIEAVISRGVPGAEAWRR